MNSLMAEPARFARYREPLTTTLTRTGGIAVVVASIACIVQLHHLPATSAQWHLWLALLVFVSWISFGGHCVEIVYLNGIRPRIARWSDSLLIVARLCVWIVGGAVLFLGALISRNLMLFSELPPTSQIIRALLIGGPAFIVVEMIAHLFLLRRGRPSFWNRRG